MQRFVQLVIAGGSTLLAGLRLQAGSPAWSPSWRIGFLATILGVGGLCGGIYRGLKGPSHR